MLKHSQMAIASDMLKTAAIIDSCFFLLGSSQCWTFDPCCLPNSYIPKFWIPNLNQFLAQPSVFAAKIGTEWYLNVVPENVHSIHNYQIVAYWKCHKWGYLIFSHTQVSYCCFVVTVIPTRFISTSYSHYVKLCSPEITFPWNPKKIKSFLNPISQPPLVPH